VLIEEDHVVAGRMAPAGYARAVPFVGDFRELIEAVRGVSVGDAALQFGRVV